MTSMNEMNFKVEDMSCGHCVKAMEEALHTVPGVLEVDISLEDKTATVKFQDDLSSDAAMTAIRGAGYTPELLG